MEAVGAPPRARRTKFSCITRIKTFTCRTPSGAADAAGPPLRRWPGTLGRREEEIRAFRAANIEFDLIERAAKEMAVLEVRYSGNRSKLEPTGSVLRIAERNRTTYHRDDVYTIAARAFHESLVQDQEIAATLVRTYVASPLAPRVLSSDTAMHEYEREPLQLAEARSALSDVIQLME